MPKEQVKTTVKLKYFDIVGMIFVAVLLISNIAAQKLFAFGPFTFTAGIIVFPIAYIFGDILTEVYGYSLARRVIWTGFFCNALLMLILAIAIWLPPAEGWHLQEQFSAVLSMVPRVILASLVGYWAGEFSNSFVLAKMKVWMSGKCLWMRTIGSTIIGQGVDTALFVIIAFYGILPLEVVIATIISGYVFKVVYEASITPVTYIIVAELKKREGIDVYDKDTDFNPFRISLNKE